MPTRSPATENANRIDGGDGDDLIAGGLGSDTLVGGSGTDTADYSASGSGVTAWLDGTAGTGGEATGDTLSGIENLLGSANADTLYGDGASNVITGGDGDDTLVGGGSGDTLTGGLGTDTASYATSASGVTANLGNAAANSGDASGDSYSGIENLTGSGQADTLTGNGSDNRLDGGAGDDTLIGGAGSDALVGGAGTDTASYATSVAAVVANLANAALNSGDASGDSYATIEKPHRIGERRHADGRRQCQPN